MSSLKEKRMAAVLTADAQHCDFATVCRVDRPICRQSRSASHNRRSSVHNPMQTVNLQPQLSQQPRCQQSVPYSLHSHRKLPLCQLPSFRRACNQLQVLYVNRRRSVQPVVVFRNEIAITRAMQVARVQPLRTRHSTLVAAGISKGRQIPYAMPLALLQ